MLICVQNLIFNGAGEPTHRRVRFLFHDTRNHLLALHRIPSSALDHAVQDRKDEHRDERERGDLDPRRIRVGDSRTLRGVGVRNSDSGRKVVV